jgi:hypothetical protein
VPDSISRHLSQFQLFLQLSLSYKPQLPPGSGPAGKGGGGLNLAVEMKILGSEFGLEHPVINTDDIGEDGGGGTIPTSRSIARDIFNDQQAVFLPFDIETAGEIAGIVKISAEIKCFKINLAKKKVGSDHADDILQVEEVSFGRHV